MGSQYSENFGSSFLSDDDQYLLTNYTDAKFEVTEDWPEDDQDFDHTGVLREQDRFLPMANLTKLMKKSIPAHGKIAKNARQVVQESVSEFISFVTSEAADLCHREKRKTMNGQDILIAMSNLGFDNYIEPLKIFLQKYRDLTRGEKVLNGDESILAVDEPNDGSLSFSTSQLDSAIVDVNVK